nr:hypothetical protein [Tanacetum cinerariifolium]
MACQIIQKKQQEKQIEEEQAAKARYWKIPACCDDDDDYDSVITPVLSIEETENSLTKDHFEIVINSNDDISSSDDDSLYKENIEYVEASPYDSELVSLEVVEIVIPKVEEIEDDNLREKLLNVHLLIAHHTLINVVASVKIPACCDDDDDYNSAITPVLSIEKPDNSLSMGDEHLDTIPAMESDEVIKSSVEDLVLIPSESEGIPDTMCDVHLLNNPTPLEAKDHFEIVINSNNDISSSDDDSLYNKNIEYVEASPHDFELVSLEVAEIVIPEDEEIEDNNLREKLLNVHLLIANIEALKDNPTPSSSFTSPKSFLEETNTFHNSLHEFENFCFDLEEISSGSTTTHSNISLSDYEAFYFDDDHIKEFPPTNRSDFAHEEFVDGLAHIIYPPEYNCFYFWNLPDPGECIPILDSEIRENLSTTSVNLPVEDDHSPLLAYVLSIIPGNVKTLAKGFYPPSLHFLSFILGI